jgi:hypothetical protein
VKRPRPEREHDKKILTDLGLKLHGRQPSVVQRMLLDDLRRTREDLDRLRTRPMTKESRRTEHVLIALTGRLLDRLAHYTGKRTR